MATKTGHDKKQSGDTGGTGTETRNNRDDDDRDDDGQGDEDQAADQRGDGGEGDIAEVEVRQKGDKFEVTRGPDSRKKIRAERRAAETRGVVNEAMRPMVERLEALQRMMTTAQQFVPPNQHERREEERPEPEAHRKRIQELRKSQQQLMTVMRATQDPKEIEQAQETYWKLQDQIEDTIADTAVERFKKSMPSPQEPEGVRQLRRLYPDVVKDPRAMILAKAKFDSARVMADMRNQPFDLAKEERLAMEEAAYELNLRQRPSPSPSEAQRSRFAGSSPGSGGSGTEFTRELSNIERSAAMAAYPELSEAEAVSAWTRRVAKAGYFK